MSYKIAFCPASIERRDGFHERIFLQNLPDYRIHKKCRTEYVDKRKIAQSAVRLFVDDITTSCAPKTLDCTAESDIQTMESNFCFSTCGIICCKSVAKVAKCDVNNITTQSLERLLDACFTNASLTSFVELQIRLSSPLVLSGKFHRKCYSKVTRNNSVKSHCDVLSATSDLMCTDSQ